MRTACPPLHHYSVGYFHPTVEHIIQIIKNVTQSKGVHLILLIRFFISLNYKKPLVTVLIHTKFSNSICKSMTLLIYSLYSVSDGLPFRNQRIYLAIYNSRERKKGFSVSYQNNRLNLSLSSG